MRAPGKNLTLTDRIFEIRLSSMPFNIESPTVAHDPFLHTPIYL